MNRRREQGGGGDEAIRKSTHHWVDVLGVLPTKRGARSVLQ